MLALAMMLIALAAAAEVSLGAISRANVRRLLDEASRGRRRCKPCWTTRPAFLLALMVLEILTFVLAAGVAALLPAAAGLQWTLVRWPCLAVGVLDSFGGPGRCPLAGDAPPERTALRLSAFMRGTSLLLSPVTAPLLALASGSGSHGARCQPRQRVVERRGPALPDQRRRGAGPDRRRRKEDDRQHLRAGRDGGTRGDGAAHRRCGRGRKTTLRPGPGRDHPGRPFAHPCLPRHIDNVQGVLYAKDLLLPFRDGRNDAPVTELMRPAYFVPESKKVDDLLRSCSSAGCIWRLSWTNTAARPAS